MYLYADSTLKSSTTWTGSSWRVLSTPCLRGTHQYRVILVDTSTGVDVSNSAYITC
ncbi:hypothetical protein [Streptomyces capitiformicae]|nr:hypothetical protein [Streptomyces capitiformicae]